MKKKILILLTAFALTCLIGCGNNEQAPASGNNPENSVVDPTKEPEPEVTTEPSSEPEATVEPTPEATEESTPEPTEEPALYEGIDMESELKGDMWIETFVGIIDEPKVVVFSDVTGKKIIVEDGAEVTINPDEDLLALYIPEGYKDGNMSQGLITSNEHAVIKGECFKIFHLDSKEMREYETWESAILVMHGEERVPLIFTIKIE